MPGGFIHEWGNISLASGDNVVSLPLTFPNNAFSVVITIQANCVATNPPNVYNLTASSFHLVNTCSSMASFYWMVDGN
jgi:hypothetical protein